MVPIKESEDESDEEMKKRERLVAERKLKYDDPRESIYSEATSMGYTAYSKMFDTPDDPPSGYK